MSDGKIDEGPSEAHFYQFAIEGVAQSIVGLLGLIGKVWYFIFMKNVNGHTCQCIAQREKTIQG